MVNDLALASAIHMDASILIVGSASFLSLFLETIHTINDYSIQTTSEVEEALHIAYAQQPDLVIVDAQLPNYLDLCRQVKLQNQLAWIYCIAVHLRSPNDGEVTLNQMIEGETQALMAGADAYVELPVMLSQPDNATAVSMIRLDGLQHRLLRARIQAGLRRVQTYRELMRTNDILSAIALSDPLTDLSNRRAFEWELPRKIQIARSQRQPISLIMLDVDLFKTINDTYGHLMGDRALQLIAARLSHNLRSYDTPFRYGGEEFVIILSDTDAAEACAIAHRLCQLISSQPFAISETVDLHITISVGTATLQLSDEARGLSCLDRADQNMLLAKNQGRNRVVCEGPSISPASEE